MTSSSNNTLVIGGAGYIGTHLTEQLLTTGRKVTVLGRSVNPRNKLPSGVKYVSGDFSDLVLMNKLLDCHQEVIHLAYATVPNTSYENPLADLLQNLPPTVQLFSEIAKRGIRLVLVSSGGTVYGEAEKLPITEIHPTKPISPYGVTKLTLENYAYLYAKTHGLEFICVRPANAYGVGQRPNVGQGFVATAMAAILDGRPVRVFGQVGSIRDYIYVTDLASGIVCALERGASNETYNLGTGVGFSNIDLINAMRPLLEGKGYKVLVEYMPERSFDVKVNVLDSNKLRSLSDWQPTVSLNEGLGLTYEWLKLNK